jgi:hypothetical protein
MLRLMLLPPIAAVELPKVLLSANSSSRKLISLRPAGVVAPPGEGRLLSVTFLGEARKVTPTAGAQRQQAKSEIKIKLRMAMRVIVGLIGN